MRKLARIEIITKVQPIEGADRIELATIKSWNVVIKKGEFKEGEKCVYFEIDSFLPVRPEFEFLRKMSYKVLADGREGFKLKTIRFKGQISQGLALPISILGSMQDKFNVGDDVSEALGVVKFEPPIPASLAGKIKGDFPEFIPKTNEERVQNLTEEYEHWKELDFFVTEKLDGTSITVYLNNGNFGVCARNFELEEDEKNSYWKVARELSLKEKLSTLPFNAAIQGELIGEGIQTNNYKLIGQTIKVFDIFNIDENRYLRFEQLVETVKNLGLSFVPILEKDFKLPSTTEELLKYADGKSLLTPQSEREGIVIRTKTGKRISFKAISNLFLLNENG